MWLLTGKRMDEISRLLKRSPLKYCVYKSLALVLKETVNLPISYWMQDDNVDAILFIHSNSVREKNEEESRNTFRTFLWNILSTVANIFVYYSFSCVRVIYLHCFSNFLFIAHFHCVCWTCLQYFSSYCLFIEMK